MVHITVLVCSLHGSVNANAITPQSIYNAVHPCWQHFRYVSFTLLHPLNLNTPHHLIAEFIGTWLLILQCRLFSVDRVWLVHKHLSHLGMQFKTRTQYTSYVHYAQDCHSQHCSRLSHLIVIKVKISKERRNLLSLVLEWRQWPYCHNLYFKDQWQSAISALQVQEIESREVCRVKQNTAMVELCHAILAGCDTLLTSASCSKACVATFTCLFTSLKLYTPHSLTTRPRLTLQMHIPSSPSP